MKTISGKVISSKPLSLSKAARFLNKFVSPESPGAPEAISRFLRRSSVSFKELVQFHRELKSGKSGRKHEKSQFEALENDNIVGIEEKDESFDFGEVQSVNYIENGGGGIDGSGKMKKKDKKNNEIKAEDEEREVGKPEKVKSLGFGDEQNLRYLENGRGPSNVEGRGKKKKNTKKCEIKAEDEEREVGKSEQVDKGRSIDLGEEKNVKYLENGGVRGDGEGSEKKKKNKKKSEIKAEDEEKEVGKSEQVDKDRSIDLGEEKNLRYLENGEIGSDGEGSGKKKKSKKKSEIKAEDVEREVGKREKVEEEKSKERKKRKKIET